MKFTKNPLAIRIIISSVLIIMIFINEIYLHVYLSSSMGDEYNLMTSLYMFLTIITIIVLFSNVYLTYRLGLKLSKDQESIKKREERYRKLFRHTSEGLYDMDSDYKMKYYSPDWYKSIGLDVNSTKIDAWINLILDEDKVGFNERYKKQLSAGQEYCVSEYRIKDIHGEIHWIEAIGRVQFDENGDFASMSGVHRDITRNKVHEQEILQMAYYDPLTNLPNRLKITEDIKEAIELNKKFTIMYLDIDNFKYINDTYGHMFGDKVIVEVSNRLKAIIHESDIVAHVGSDEFVIISSSYINKKQIEGYVYYILNEINSQYIIENTTLKFTSSMGVAVFPEDASTLRKLMINVDIARYDAKENRNRYRFYEASMGKLTAEKANIKNALLKSIENNELYLNYQPIIDFSTKEIAGFEALARWENQELGQIYPDEFIPMAEQTGFIHQLGYFVLEEAIKFVSILFHDYKKYYKINVNVSTIQLQDEKFLDHVQEVLVKYQFPAKYLNLEITESLELENNIKMRNLLSNIRKMGVEISIDDFGTGYSSVNSLISLSVSHIKIDKTLVQQATTIQEVHKLIKGVVDFSHAMNMLVVAEGVETKGMEDIVLGLNVDYLQGYYYSKPISEEKVREFILK